MYHKVSSILHLKNLVSGHLGKGLLQLLVDPLELLLLGHQLILKPVHLIQEIVSVLGKELLSSGTT